MASTECREIFQSISVHKMLTPGVFSCRWEAPVLASHVLLNTTLLPPIAAPPWCTSSGRKTKSEPWIELPGLDRSKLGLHRRTPVTAAILWARSASAKPAGHLGMQKCIPSIHTAHPLPANHRLWATASALGPPHLCHAACAHPWLSRPHRSAMRLFVKLLRESGAQSSQASA